MLPVSDGIKIIDLLNGFGVAATFTAEGFKVR
jgi:hypothetical protein